MGDWAEGAEAEAISEMGDQHALREQVKRLEFVRVAQPGDLRDLNDSLWRDPVLEQDGWLEAHQVLTWGLTDKMREGLSRSAQPPIALSEATEDTRSASSDPVKVHARPPSSLVQGGRSDAWRWDRVQDGEHVVWCIDNKPAVEAAAEDPTVPPVEYQRVMLPEPVLQVIASLAS